MKEGKNGANENGFTRALPFSGLTKTTTTTSPKQQQQQHHQNNNNNIDGDDDVNTIITLPKELCSQNNVLPTKAGIFPQGRKDKVSTSRDLL